MPTCEFCEDGTEAVVKIQIKSRVGFACADCRDTYSSSYSRTFKIKEVLKENSGKSHYIRMGDTKAHKFKKGSSESICKMAEVENTESFAAVDKFGDLPERLKCGSCEDVSGDSTSDIMEKIREECDLEPRKTSTLTRGEAKTVLNRLKYGI